jgi:hypothetical protein
VKALAAYLAFSLLSLCAAVPAHATQPTWHQTAFFIGGHGPNQFGDSLTFKRLNEAGIDLVHPVKFPGGAGAIWERGLAARTLLTVRDTTFHLRLLGDGSDSTTAAADTLLAYTTARQLWVADEPRTLTETRAYASRAKSIIDTATTPAVALVNLNPPFGEHPIPDYPAYVDSFLAQFTSYPPQLVSADNYLFQVSSHDPGTNYSFTLRTLRDEAAKFSTPSYSVPFWMWIQLSHNFDDSTYTYLTTGEIRYEAYTALAYGAKGIMYWTLSPLHAGAGANYDSALVDSSGHIANDARYSAIQTLNGELHTLGATLVTLAPIAVQHEDVLEQLGIDDELFSTPYPRVHIGTGEDSHSQWCMMGYFRAYDAADPGDYVLVVNKDTVSAHTFVIDLETTADSVYRISRTDGSHCDVLTHVASFTASSLPAGTGDLFRVITWTRRPAVVSAEGAFPAMAVSRADGRRHVFFSRNNSLSTTDMPAYSYYIRPPHLLRHAYDSLGVWQSHTIDTDDAGERSATADYAGHAWVAYHWSPADSSVARGGLRCAHFTGSGWTIETVDSSNSYRAPVGRFPSLCLDYSGHPWIAYWDSVHHQVRVARKPGASWLIDTVATVADLEAVVASIAITADGTVRVAYNGLSGGHSVLRLASKPSATWVSATADSGRGDYSWASLRYDCQGNPHIAYASRTAADGAAVFHAVQSGGTWSYEVADSIPNWSNAALKWVDLELDGHDQPRISYSAVIGVDGEPDPPLRDQVVTFPDVARAQVDLRLRYASKAGTWTGEDFDPYSQYEFASLGLDNNGRPNIAYLADGRLKVASRAGWSDVGDIVAPTVPTLSADCTDPDNSIWELTWTASADDSTCKATGPASTYDMRTRSSSITSSNWGTSSLLTGPTPGMPGNGEALNVVISASTYCRMLVKDVLGNGRDSTKYLSNQVHMIPCWGDGSFAGGDGGGGEASLKQSGGMNSMVPGGGGTGRSAANGENSLLPGSGFGVKTRDLLALSRELGTTSWALYVREAEGRSLDVDAVRLMCADHDSGTEVFATGNTVLAGTRSGLTAVDSAGTDLTEQLNGSAGVVSVLGGATLLVSTPLDSARTAVIVQAEHVGAGGAPIMVESRQGGSDWQMVGEIEPRAHAVPAIVDSVAAGQIRLEFTGDCRVYSIARLVRSTTSPSLTWAQLDAASTSGVPDALSTVASSDSIVTTLGGLDTLRLTFSAEAPVSGLVRDVFIDLDGTPARVVASQANRLEQVANDLPLRFALRQNQPNPFHAGTLIRFDLPIGQIVHVEIFDAQGRLVRQLVNRFIPAGYQSAYWDKQDSGGNTVRPGVFFYRLRSDVFRDRKKMVLLR